MFKNKKKKQEELVENEVKLEEKDVEVESNGEEKPSIKKTFNLYKFILKILIAVILITFGILMLIFKQESIFVLILMSGLVTAIAAAIRFFGLFKKNKTPQAKKIQAILCAIHLIIGAYLITAAFLYNSDLAKNGADNLGSFSKFNRQYYPLFMGVVLYLQAVMYFWQTVLYKANTTKFMFWLHIIYMTLAVVLVYLVTGGNETNIAEKVVMTIAIIALVLALLSAGEAMYGYFSYHNYINRDKKPKEKKKDEEDVIEAPTTDESVDVEIIDPENHDGDSARIS